MTSHSARLLVDAALAVRAGQLGEAARVAIAVVDLELAGQTDVLRLQVAQRMVRQLGELNGTLAVAEGLLRGPRDRQLVLPWRR